MSWRANTIRGRLAVVASSCVVALMVDVFGAPQVTQAALVPTESVSALAAAESVSVKPVATATVKKKLVFAHYHLQYPISKDNKVASEDYYTKEYLSPQGEGGSWSDYGGYLRDRPLPQDPIPAGQDWELTNLTREIDYARRGGIDGFAINVWPKKKYPEEYRRAIKLVQAAKLKSFRIMLQPDLTFTSPSADEIAADLIGLVRTAPGVIYKDSADRVIVSPYGADIQTPVYWRNVLAAMSRLHSPSVLWPLLSIYGVTASSIQAWKSISIGVSDWGARNPAEVWTNSNIAKQAGKLWMQPVSVQDARPHGNGDKTGYGQYEEAANTSNLRANWSVALGARNGFPAADLVLLTTWNDYGETSHFAPSRQHGFALLDLNSYYVRAYKAGKVTLAASQIGRERLFVSHRVHGYTFKPKYKFPMVWRNQGTATKPRNTFEVVTFLKFSAKVVVRIGTKKYSYSAPSGVYVRTFSLRDGFLSAAFIRSGRTYTAATGMKVTSVRTVQDMGYLYAGVSR